MVLRCSLLGHDYGDPEVERERDERGSEVVVTVQEFEECSRCGDRNVISENTEVTSLSAEREIGSLSSDRELESSEPSTATDAELIDADESVDPELQPAGDESGASAAAQTDVTADETPTVSAADDGEIIDAEGSSIDHDRDGRRERGEWPDAPDTDAPADPIDDATAEWPAADDVAEPVDADGVAEPVDDDGVVLEHDAGGPAVETPSEVVTESEPAEDATIVTETEPKEDPAVATETATDISQEDATVVTESATDAQSQPSFDADTGIERDGEARGPTTGPAPGDDVPMEFYCPRCDYVPGDDRGSLRAGDICPDCQRGYLGERPKH